MASSLPPGLDAATAAEELLANPDAMAEAVKGAILEDLGQKVAELTPSAAEANISPNAPGMLNSEDHAAQAVRLAVLQVVDQKVAEKSEELWKKGKQALAQIQQRQKENQQRLADQVKQCRERQSNLEAENNKLKQVLAGLASRFAMLGAAFHTPGGVPPTAGASPPATPGLTPQPPGGLTPVPTPQVEASLAASPPSEAVGGTEDVLPGDKVLGASLGGPGAGGALPEVPPFPLLVPVSPTAATPLSLAEGLGLAAKSSQQQKTPLSLASSLTPSSRTPEGGPSSLSPFPPGSSAPSGPAGSFTFTLRKADGANLGLDVIILEQDKVLLVKAVQSDGAVEAWNRQCAQNSAQSEKIVQAGDKILSVNAVSSDPQKMLEECVDKRTLRLCLMHGDRASADTGAKGAATAGSVMRADAAAFVPRGSGSSLASASPQPEALEEPTTSSSNEEAATHRV